MRISLVTRIFTGYLLVLFLLGGVVVYCIVTMGKMQEEVTIAKKGLLPISARFSRLSRELSQTAALLRRGNCEEALWLSHYLPQFKPFETLESIADSLDELSANQHLGDKSRELFASVSGKISVIVAGDSMYAGIAEQLKKAGLEVVGSDDRAFYDALVERFLYVSATTPAQERTGALGQLRKALEKATVSLRRDVLGFEASCRFAINNAWSDTIELEGNAVRVALYLGVAALVVIVAVFLLFLSWLKPLGALRVFARKIAMGEYDQPLPSLSGDEVGDLSRELGKMAHRLKEREEMIRRQAAELLRADRFSTIGKMSTQIAHEIRNPLNALGLNLELLEDGVEEVRGSLSAEAYEGLLRTAVAGGKEIDRLREITDYYLKFAKFPKVEKERVDLHMVLTDTVSFYEEEARRKGVAIEREIERHLRANVDPNLIRHALANLLRNSIEAITESSADAEERVGGRISVKAWQQGRQVRLTIKDNGPGIPPEKVGRVFEPFFSTKRSGTGLGLTLVQQIVDEHGGSITCTSTLGEGTVFTVAIPI